MATPWPVQKPYREVQPREVEALRMAAERALRWFMARENGQLSSFSQQEDLLIARALAAALADLQEHGL